MIHGERDNYIKPEMAKDLYSRARTPKELWVVKGAKHNKALEVANDEYREKTLGFFQAHLAPAERRRLARNQHRCNCQMNERSEHRISSHPSEYRQCI